MQDINGFKVVGDYWINDKNVYKCRAMCKVCGKEFLTNYHALHRMKSCGCDRPSQLKPLPEYINGFKIIKCKGYNTVRKDTRWALVECKVCKREYEAAVNNLKYRKHCGCMRKGVIACKYAKSHPQLAQTYKHMISRCYRENDKDYYNYGARGITVCSEWLEDRNKFCEWSLAHGFENNKGLSIDRVDNDKGYSPDNCRWSDSVAQSRNTRRTKLTLDIALKIREDYKTMTQQALANKYNVSKGTIGCVVRNKTWKET